MKSALLILAAGKSSRFGGFPKAFCEVDGSYVVQRTVELGAQYFDHTYLVINKELYPEYRGKVSGCKTLAIGTGQGDSHSFLRAARLIKEDCGADRITLCWGDTFYLGDSVFKRSSELCREDLDETVAGISIASMDREPYAWYETDGEVIKASHFRSNDGFIEQGVHDQSIFVFNLDIICSQLELYMRKLGINDEEDYISKDISKEMKLLDSFTFFYESGLKPMKYSIIESGGSYSFNTNEELEAIHKKLGKV